MEFKKTLQLGLPLLLAIGVAAVVVAAILQASVEKGKPQKIIQDDSLVLTPVVTGEEPFILGYSFSAPAGTNAGRYRLVLLDNGRDAVGYDFTRQTNGMYLVRWNTTFASYGPHALQIEIIRSFQPLVRGPTRTEVVTNLVQFDMNAASFRTQAWIYGVLHVPSVDYEIEIYDTNKNLLKTITGHTDKGVIDRVWNLKTEGGQLRQDHEFDAKIYLKPTAASTNNASGTNTFSIGYPYYLFRSAKLGGGD